jgi:hypothetical protein
VKKTAGVPSRVLSAGGVPSITAHSLTPCAVDLLFQRKSNAYDRRKNKKDKAQGDFYANRPKFERATKVVAHWYPCVYVIGSDSIYDGAGARQ